MAILKLRDGGGGKRPVARPIFLVPPLLLAGAIALTLFLQLPGTETPPEEAKCLKYSPEVVTLRGMVKKEMLPNPETETEYREPAWFWFLYLEKPICVYAEPEEAIPLSGVDSIQRIQLIGMDSPRHPSYSHLENKKVAVTGELMPKIRASHFTKVHLFITLMEQAP